MRLGLGIGVWFVLGVGLGLGLGVRADGLAAERGDAGERRAVAWLGFA